MSFWVKSDILYTPMSALPNNGHFRCRAISCRLIHQPAKVASVNGQAQGLGGRKIDYQFKLSRLFDRQISEFGTLKILSM